MGYIQSKNTAWKWFSKYIRLRDCLATTRNKEYGKCCSCNALKSFKEAQAGHFISGRHNAVLFDETGVHLQCVRCNKYLNGNPSAYYQFMLRKYGEEFTLRKLEGSKKIIKFTEVDMREISDKYRELYKELDSTGNLLPK